MQLRLHTVPFWALALILAIIVAGCCVHTLPPDKQQLLQQADERTDISFQLALKAESLTLHQVTSSEYYYTANGQWVNEWPPPPKLTPDDYVYLGGSSGNSTSTPEPLEFVSDAKGFWYLLERKPVTDLIGTVRYCECEVRSCPFDASSLGGAEPGSPTFVYRLGGPFAGTKTITYTAYEVREECKKGGYDNCPPFDPLLMELTASLSTTRYNSVFQSERF